jgi:hypothetical protein
VVKLYKSTAAKPAAFRKVAIQAAVEASGFPFHRLERANIGIAA